MLSFSRAFFVSSLAALAITCLAPTPAHALPGTCRCEKTAPPTIACRRTPGQCVTSNGCRIGYAPNCATIVLTTLCTVAPNKFECTGTCNCVPIPGFCDSVGGADFCDGGVPDVGPDAPDTRDTAVTDAPDTFVPPDVDTGTATDAPDTATDVDTGTPPDVDTGTPPPDVDTGTPPDVDTGTPPPDADAATDIPDVPVPDVPGPDVPDSETPGCTFECDPGKRSVDIPGESCKKFCAEPCGTGERRCVKGFTCDDGFCKPDCLLTPCPTCAICNLYDTDLDAGVFPGYCRTTDPSDPACKPDAGDDGGSDTGGTTDSGGDAGDGGPIFVDPNGPPPEDACCAVAPGHSNANTTRDGALAAIGLAAAIFVARRRNKQ